MNSSRRQFLHLATVAMAFPGVMQIAWAQTYPVRPVRILVGFAAGGATDVAARLMARWLSERLRQQFVVENRPGAGGNIATEAVVKSPPDGYTLLAGGVGDAVNATLFEELNFNFSRDITPVAGIMRVPNVMVVHPSLPAKTVPEFIGYAKANPGKLNMASGGIGTGPHMAGELFKMMSGVNIVHVPYRGGAPAITDLIAGQVQLMFTVPALTIEHVRAGKLRALAVTTTARLEGLPDLPTVNDFLPGYEADNWFGIFAPKNTPAEIVNKLNREINVGLADSKTKTRLADLGGATLTTSPDEFGKLIVDETEKWGKVIRAANIKPE
jgi:tripartite-type tricarboxylate transporter receptor subunit TctC